MPTKAAGSWLDATMASIAAQDYPSLNVTVVHAPGEADLLEMHRRTLPDLQLVESADGAGFGRQVMQAIESATEPLLLICHDDVRFEPGAVSALVKERLRRADDRAIIAPKLVDWNDPTQLMPGAFEADRFGATAAMSRPGDLDQGQQDRVADIFGSGTPALLLDRKGLLQVGGFDPAIDWHGEAHDICLRMRLAGARVVLASAAVVRHRAAWDEREGVQETFRLRRHQMRSVLGAARGVETVQLLVSFAVLHLIEAVVALVRLDLGELLSIPAAWLWNLRHAGSLRERRSTMNDARTMQSDELRLVRRRGSIRIADSVDRRITNREDATERGEQTISPVRVAGAGVIGALLLFGARHLLTRPIPQVGEFRAVPDDLGTLTGSWWSALRTAGMGAEGYASFALPLLDVLGIVTFGSAGLLRALLMLAPIPVGVIGAWRLFNRSASDRAPVAAAALYAASPLPYNAVVGGSWQALMLYASAPWMVASIIGVVRSPSFGLARPRNVSITALATILAVVGAFTPWVAMVFAILVVGYVLGSFLAGDMRGVAVLIPTAAIAAAIAAALNAPHLLGFDRWYLFGTASRSEVTDTTLASLLTLDTGPIGSPLFGWSLLAVALFPVLSGTGARFTWAMRVWGWMLLTWAIVWASARGWSPVGLPVLEMMLVPVSLGFAILGGIGAQVIDIDLSGARARRTIPAVIAVVGFAVAMLPMIEGAASGRWGLARTDLTTSFGAVEPLDDLGPYRVVWIGDAHVLGASAVPTANGLAFFTSLDGAPDITALWGGPVDTATEELSDTIAAGLDGRTSRLGRELADFGVRFVVVVDQQAPVPEVSRRDVVSDARAVGLSKQLDLVRTGVVNPAVIVYENTAAAPMHSAVAPAALEVGRLDDAAPAVAVRDGHADWSGQVRVERDVYLAWQPSDRWELRVDGIVAPRVENPAVGVAFETAGAPGAGDATLGFATSSLQRSVIVLQAAGWIILAFVRRWIVGRDRRRQRLLEARTERAA